MDAIDDDINELRLDIDERIYGEDECSDRNFGDDLGWTIDRLANRWNGEWINSGTFNACSGRYPIELICSWRCNRGDDVHIYLCMFTGDGDTYSRWAFNRSVTISIMNNCSPNVHRSVTKRISIANSQYYDRTLGHPFIFSHRDLSNAALLLGNRMDVTCYIGDE